MKRTVTAILAVLILTFGLAFQTQPASATTGVLDWRVNYHGITWTGWWDNWAGNASCVYSVNLYQGIDGRAYAEAYNFGYGIGACTDVYGNGSGADVYNQGGTNQYRMRLDYKLAGITYTVFGGWVGALNDPYNGINQTGYLVSPGYGFPYRACVEATNMHATSPNYPWEDAVGAWENHCVYY